MVNLNQDVFNLLVCSGDYGMGKSYRIIEFVDDNEVDYAYVQSYATPLSFYKILHENKDKKMIIFDDVNSIDHKIIVGLLKSACWGVLNGEREVSYYTTSDVMEREGLPEKFELKANIVLVFNDKFEGYASIVNRGVCIDFNFSFDEKMKIFEEMKEEVGIDEEILEYIGRISDLTTRNLSIRSLVILSKLKDKGFDWKAFAKEILNTNEDKKVLIEMLNKHDTITEARDEWCAIMGKGKRTFFNKKKQWRL